MQENSHNSPSRYNWIHRYLPPESCLYSMWTAPQIFFHFINKCFMHLMLQRFNPMTDVWKGLWITLLSAQHRRWHHPASSHTRPTACIHPALQRSLHESTLCNRPKNKFPHWGHLVPTGVFKKMRRKQHREKFDAFGILSKKQCELRTSWVREQNSQNRPCSLTDRKKRRYFHFLPSRTFSPMCCVAHTCPGVWLLRAAPG